MGTVQEARQALGLRLRGLRLAAKLTGRDLAQQAGWNNSKVSRFEHGKQVPTSADIHTWCTITDSARQIPDLLATVRNIDADYLELRRVTARRLQQDVGRMEASVEQIRGYESDVIPGLLQTRAYATAILQTVIAFEAGEEEVDAAVDERVKRRTAVLDNNAPRCHFILGEQALYSSFGDDEVMIEQLEQLLDDTQQPWLELGIVPRTAYPRVLTTSFAIYGGSDTIHVGVELLTEVSSITDPGDTSRYEKGFRLLSETAEAGDSARELIRQALTVRRKDHDHQ
ncbi:DUF5753 domain-containing protein [Nocardia sp. NPDC003183]